eukprot:TRINITY_DN8126_c0_g1_i2.p1 TRINITY_DN8126_c0_g1~~TRINITY_DN8126_c0_g1_i2.p1  ORF type:complete len:140 (+),score=7.15 TRINITY_DN8126_c0_g1_i2:291-710(+)
MQLKRQSLAVRFARGRTEKELPLDINRSIELANYYIGFDRWSSSIQRLDKEELTVDQNGHHTCTYVCDFQFMLTDGRSFVGTGRATGGGKDKANVIEFAKKNAVTDARKKTFQQIALIILEDGKVAVHFLLEPYEDCLK